HEPAHGGRAHLSQMPVVRLGPLAVPRFPDALAEPPRPEQPDRERRSEEGDHEPRGRGDQDGGHPAPRCIVRSSSAATARSSNGITLSANSWPVSWPFPAITTASPARACPTPSRYDARLYRSTVPTPPPSEPHRP